ncbi:uncharacterized protein LOC130533538 isoform X1 [Takifugu flavidus]|uniref:uncharacterized protein LOC130533538 isoform X1 n=1 Tax=Takifugu flavidus TaxID=433684 RepID=UPI002544B543|nr:uncharacterized protein LOC130533538 isoform X1 [Takifugu flavidus]XP_056903020.1 uncharacterized protein LOC130533538 isoform X1 [Takifugu flavidus]XP_056903021.1 uncharacterized protein LOC130533538 isoform X1 [Takifugu flavidus]
MQIGDAPETFRAAAVPEVVGEGPNETFRSICPAAREVQPSWESIHPDTACEGVTYSSTTTSSMSRVSNPQPDDGAALRDGEKGGRAERHGLMDAEGDGKPGVHVRSFVDRSSQRSHWSCVHIEVPLMFNSATLFLDKSLLISIIELEDRTVGEPALFRSTLFIRLGASPRNQPTKRGQGRGGQAASPGHQSGGCAVQQAVPACYGTGGAADSDPQLHGNPLGLLSFRRPEPSNTQTGWLKENADEFRHKPLTSNLDPAQSLMWRKQAAREKMEDLHDCRREPQECATLENTCCGHGSLTGKTKYEGLSLKEALELFRPDFISRSQGRVRKMEQRALRRRALRGTKPDSVHADLEKTCRQRRKCTTPDPLSDNLFKPRERSISGREMQLRSRRIYNKLPEVTKKKEDEKKRAVSQTNRRRVQVFKKTGSNCKELCEWNILLSEETLFS